MPEGPSDLLPGRARGLGANNQRLGSKIQEQLERKGPRLRGWGHYSKTAEGPRAQTFARSVDGASFCSRTPVTCCR